MTPFVRFAAVVLMAIPSVVDAQSTDPKVAAYDAYVAKAFKDWGAVGLSVSVVKDGKTVYAKGYGVRELGKPDPADANTMYSIGSTTKAMTAAAIGMLVDEGKVRWDDRVIDHLPGFELADAQLTSEVTVRDLLTHRAGLANGDVLWVRTDFSPEEVLRRARFIRIAYPPRSGFIYQNVMYAAAGAVVAAASGMSWEQFVTTRIFKPLGMTRTVATLAGTAGMPNVAAPHDRGADGKIRVVSNSSVDAVAAAGSIWSSVTDMAKWAAFMIDSARVDGKRLLKPETWAELFTPQTIVSPSGFYPSAQLSKPNWSTYGLGWFQRDYHGRMVQFHTGSINGLIAIIGLIPEERLGVYVLGNLDHVEVRHALMLKAFDHWLGLGNRDWSTDLLQLYRGMEAAGDSARARTERSRLTGTKPSLALDRYTGSYADSMVGPVKVTLVDGRLHLRASSQRETDLDHWHLDTFAGRWESWDRPSLFNFSIAANGTVDALVMGGRRLGRVRQ